MPFMAGVAIMQEKEIETTEIFADWEGELQKTNYEKILIPEDSYNCIIKAVEVIEVPDFNDKTKKVSKIAISLALTEGEAKDKELTHFVSPKIMKANPNAKGKIMSNSKLYDLLCDTGLKEDAKTKLGAKITPETVKAYLEDKMVGKKVRVAVKTSKANTPEAYSTASKILRFTE
jgi:hypothetical protein